MMRRRRNATLSTSRWVRFAVFFIAITIVVRQVPYTTISTSETTLSEEAAFTLPSNVQPVSVKANHTASSSSSSSSSSIPYEYSNTQATTRTSTGTSTQRSTRSSSSISTSSSSHSKDGGFGACLLIMDDNHFLIEWLAYHSYVLPLKQLIVAVDPKSKTSPTEILDRYRHFIEIQEWTDPDYMTNVTTAAQPMESSKNSSSERVQVYDMYLLRQRMFYMECMKAITLRQQQNPTGLRISHVAIITTKNGRPTLDKHQINTTRMKTFRMPPSFRPLCRSHLHPGFRFLGVRLDSACHYIDLPC
jgi:hypothetical protein